MNICRSSLLVGCNISLTTDSSWSLASLKSVILSHIFIFRCFCPLQLPGLQLQLSHMHKLCFSCRGVGLLNHFLCECPGEKRQRQHHLKALHPTAWQSFPCSSPWPTLQLTQPPQRGFFQRNGRNITVSDSSFTFRADCPCASSQLIIHSVLLQQHKLTATSLEQHNPPETQPGTLPHDSSL